MDEAQLRQTARARAGPAGRRCDLPRHPLLVRIRLSLSRARFCLHNWVPFPNTSAWLRFSRMCVVGHVFAVVLGDVCHIRHVCLAEELSNGVSSLGTGARPISRTPSAPSRTVNTADRLPTTVQCSRRGPCHMRTGWSCRSMANMCRGTWSWKRYVVLCTHPPDSITGLSIYI